jgi:hypothetical protein
VDRVVEVPQDRVVYQEIAIPVDKVFPSSLLLISARLAQSAERKALNLVVWHHFSHFF